VLEHFTRQIECDFTPRERRIGDEANEGSFELADIRFDAAGNMDGDVVWQRHRFGLGFSLENRDFGFEIGRLNIRSEPPLKSRWQKFFERWNFIRRAIAA